MILIAVTTFLSFKMNSMGNMEDPTMKMMPIMMSGMIIITATFMPTGLGIYWVTSNIFTIIQNIAFPCHRPFIISGNGSNIIIFCSQFFAFIQKRSLHDQAPFSIEADYPRRYFRFLLISSARWRHWRPEVSFSLSPAGCVHTIPWRSHARISSGNAATCIHRIWFALLSRIHPASRSCIHCGTIPAAAHSFAARCAYPRSQKGRPLISTPRSGS